MLSTTEFFVHNKVKFNSHKEIITIFSYKSEQLELIKNISFKSFNDVVKYKNEFFKIFEELRTIEFYPIITVPLTNLYEFSFTPINRLVSRKKEQYEHIKSSNEVFKAIKSHYNNNFPLKSSSKLKPFILSFEDLQLDTQIRDISSIVEEELHILRTKKERTLIDLKTKEQEKKKITSSITSFEEELEQFEKNYTINVKKQESLKLKHQKLISKLQDSKLKRQRLEHQIREIELSLQELHENSDEQKLFIPLWQAVASAGLLCYSKLNSYEYQQYKLKKQIFSNKKNIEQLNSQELTLNFKIEQLNKDLKEISSKTSQTHKEELHTRLEQHKQEVLEVQNFIFEFEKSLKEINFEIDNCNEYSTKRLILDLNLQIEKIIEQYEMVNNYIEILTISSKSHQMHKDEDLKDGFYYLQKI
ncbi:MAG: hypothetical protein ACMXYB_01205 [Candidatus Woesearchaeota archaeon]